jgi:hypothetical protein
MHLPKQKIAPSPNVKKNQKQKKKTDLVLHRQSQTCANGKDVKEI